MTACSARGRVSTSRKYASSRAPVYLYARTVPPAALNKIEGMGKSYDRQEETWFCRRSVHEN